MKSALTFWGSSESRLPLFVLPDANQIVSATQVPLSINGGTKEAVQGGVGKGKRMIVLDGNLVKPHIVGTEVKTSVFLFDEEEPHGGKRG